MPLAPRWTAADLAAYKARFRHTAMAPTTTRDAADDAAPTGAEPKLQADVEAWLRHRGYYPRTEKYIAAGTPPSGWYIHLTGTKTNPLLLDLLILHNSGRVLELELKTATGRVKLHQQQLLANTPYTRLARSLAEAIHHVTTWEQEIAA